MIISMLEKMVRGIIAAWQKLPPLYQRAVCGLCVILALMGAVAAALRAILDSHNPARMQLALAAFLLLSLALALFIGGVLPPEHSENEPRHDSSHGDEEAS